MSLTRKPPWVLPPRDPLLAGAGVRRVLRELGLATVCESARCPNRGACFAAGTATFLLLGGVCTRRCGFCAVGAGVPEPPDTGEPAAVAAAVRRLGISYAVVTSVTRDDLPDGGAAAFAATVAAIRGLAPTGGAPPPVELLVPDFAGAPAPLATILDAGPDVLAHNLETVRRLSPAVRPGARYERSLALLRRAGELAPGVPTKSGLMAGLGEEPGELLEAIRDLSRAGVTFLTLGQYLAPGRRNFPVARFLEPEEFDAFAAAAREAGIPHVAAGPLVRSSYRARELWLAAGGATGAARAGAEA